MGIKFIHQDHIFVGAVTMRPHFLYEVLCYYEVTLRLRWWHLCLTQPDRTLPHTDKPELSSLDSFVTTLKIHSKYVDPGIVDVTV